MKKLTLLSVGLLSLASVGLSPAYAKENACSADLQKYCADASNWKDKASCLREHKADLSPGCQAARQKMKEKRKEKIAQFKQACGPDVQAHCANIPDGKGKGREVFQCLKNNENSLSNSCKSELGQLHRHFGGQTAKTSS